MFLFQGCFISYPTSSLSSQSNLSSYQTSQQYINEFCWRIRDHNSCIIDALKNARNYIGYRDNLFFNCTTKADTKKRAEDLLKEARRFLSDDEWLKLSDYFTDWNDITKDFQDDWNDCSNERSQNRAVDCLEDVSDRSLSSLGC